MTNWIDGSARRSISAAVCIAALATPLIAAEGDDPRFELGLQAGARLADRDFITLTDDDDVGELFGVAGAATINDWIAWFMDANYSSHDSEIFPDANILTVRTGLEARFKNEKDPAKSHWFIGLGPGWMDVDLGTSSADFDRTIMSLSVGRRHVMKSGVLRYELRGDSSLSDDGLGGERVTNVAALLGWSWGVGKQKDADGDGVIDRRDKCPDTPAGATVDATGCPKDSDGDGVYDGIDKCPDTPKGATVDATGCPKDTDGDGVYDGIDKCPKTPKGATVDATGCPKDTDGDGVYDGIDKCPDTPKGTPVDETGCAKELFKGEERTLILEGVNFEFNSATLTANATTILDRVAASLKDWPEIRVEVGGHTDSVGTERYNADLSQKRADSVKAYLVSKGIDASRMTTRGYGESVPVADNGTKDGRALNRRVELKRLD